MFLGSLVTFTKGRLPSVGRRLINSGEFRYQRRFLHLSLSHETLSEKKPFLFNIGQVARGGTETSSDWLFLFLTSQVPTCRKKALWKRESDTFKVYFNSNFNLKEWEYGFQTKDAIRGSELQCSYKEALFAINTTRSTVYGTIHSTRYTVHSARYTVHGLQGWRRNVVYLPDSGSDSGRSTSGSLQRHE